MSRQARARACSSVLLLVAARCSLRTVSMSRMTRSLWYSDSCIADGQSGRNRASMVTDQSQRIGTSIEHFLQVGCLVRKRTGFFAKREEPRVASLLGQQPRQPFAQVGFLQRHPPAVHLRTVGYESHECAESTRVTSSVALKFATPTTKPRRAYLVNRCS